MKILRAAVILVGSVVGAYLGFRMGAADKAMMLAGNYWDSVFLGTFLGAVFGALVGKLIWQIIEN